MPRPPLPPGTYGKIKTWQDGKTWLARVKFRDYDGAIRLVKRSDKTKAGAVRELKAALADRQRPVRQAEITPHTTMDKVATLWLAEIERAGADVLAWAKPKTPLLTRHAVGEGAVIVATVPRLLGQDERAHPLLPFLMNGLTANLLPVEVRRADGTPLHGEVLYQVNKTRDGYLVLLVNNRGVDKTPNGVARVDRRAFADVMVRTARPVKSVREWTEPQDLSAAKGEGGWEVRLRVHPGDVQVVSIILGK